MTDFKSEVVKFTKDIVITFDFPLNYQAYLFQTCCDNITASYQSNCHFTHWYSVAFMQGMKEYLTNRIADSLTNNYLAARLL